jgi:cell fate (sporulation/competence/biofilm development) regulator YlbF (YheA/YmcA/DUF963 family)
MTANDNGPIVQKTRELCQTILDEPEFQNMRRRIDAFLADEGAKAQYHELTELSALLRHKQQMGLAAEGGEFEDFEKKREVFLSNPVATGFLAAQETMQQVRDTVTRYVTRTFELGRLPGPEDFETCGCGSGCGCSH